jgi:hypothetical protein
LCGLFDEKADMVLKCRDMAELVTPYLEGTLSRRARFDARLHLWLCAACRRYVDQMRRTIAFLSSGPRSDPSENERKIMELLDNARRGR